MADSSTPLTEDEDKKPVGRPLKYKTVAELDLAIQTYFDECDPHVIKHLEATGFNERGQTTWAERSIMSEQTSVLPQPYERSSNSARGYGSCKAALAPARRYDADGR